MINIRETLLLAFKTSIFIIKLIFPLYILADVLFYFNILNKISFIFEPVTGILHLPPESAVGIAAGMLFNIYAAVAFLAPLNLSPYQWTIIGVFLGIAHAILIESAIMKKLEISVFYSIALRVFTAFIGALLVTFIPFSFSSNINTNSAIELSRFNSFSKMIVSSITKATTLSFKIVVLISIIIFFINFSKSLPFIKKYQEKVNTSFPIFIGLFLGITYGAGILISEFRSGNLKSKNIFFVATFLLISHAIIEDPALFMLFGANGFVMIGIRVILAITVSFFLTILYEKFFTESKLYGQK
ncbi:hypothetical protein [Desulfurobacterium atlanticum]|uniref:Nucleoside recognition n=1 Tax=Desulfurobacterium atlanticum TaxID=240169 RepID=A0A239A1V1_9BACT|nr:hypothetical protein [Desulfurobacterium atlanticum]SNR89271.1 hypothetical protein SAMN06265340_11417 [Desulfurobacterium atlanticum]